jgi:hypothetical protein
MLAATHNKWRGQLIYLLRLLPVLSELFCENNSILIIYIVSIYLIAIWLYMKRSFYVYHLAISGATVPARALEYCVLTLEMGYRYQSNIHRNAAYHATFSIEACARKKGLIVLRFRQNTPIECVFLCIWELIWLNFVKIVAKLHDYGLL